MQEYTLVVPSIGCQGCMKKIVTKLQSFSGIEIVQTDVAGKCLTLRYAPEEMEVAQIVQAIRDIGHRVALTEPILAGEEVSQSEEESKLFASFRAENHGTGCS